MPTTMSAIEALNAYLVEEYEHLAPSRRPTGLDLLRKYAVSSVVPGICMDRDCQAITDRCEPDAVTNWCHECHGQTVRSLSAILLEVEL